MITTSTASGLDSVLPPGKTALGVFQPGAPWDFSALNSLETQIGREARIVHWFQGWGAAGSGPAPAQWQAVHDRGAIPMITWEPFDWTKGVSDTAFLPRLIAGGTHDAYIRSWAQAAAAYGEPIFLRFAHEMNGNWYPWALGVHDNTAAEYKDAWRRCVSIFRQEGASNVSWVWCPSIEAAGVTPLDASFPGDDVVDLVGFDAYNGGTALNWGGWLSFDQLFGPSLRKLSSFSARPPMICETASTESGGSKAAWITDMFVTQVAQAHPEIRAVTWFNEAKETDWRIQSSSASLDAFRSAIAASRYAA